MRDGKTHIKEMNTLSPKIWMVTVHMSSVVSYWSNEKYNEISSFIIESLSTYVGQNLVTHNEWYLLLKD